MGMTNIRTPTRTLYAVWTTRVTPTRVETEVLPLRPSTVTNVVTTCEYGGDGNCWLATTTQRALMTESVTTRARTVTGSPSVSTVSSPTATLFATTRIPLSAASSFPSGMESASGPSGASLVTRTITSSFSLPETSSSKTLVGEVDLPDPTAAASPQRLRIAAIVGGLIGGFITPILLVFLIRYLLKRRRIRGGGSGFLSPSMRSNASFAPSRALSPSATLARSPTLTEGGYLAAGVDRRPSRASRASRITHDPRYYPNSSPSASSHGHGPVSSHGHDPVGNPPVRRPSVVHYAPDPVMRAASPSRIRTPSPVLHRNGTINSVAPVPPVPYMPPMAYDTANPLSYPISIPQPTFAPLASVAEGSPTPAPTPLDQPIELTDITAKPVPPREPTTERTQNMPDNSPTNS